jgi:ribosomal protein S18 acetylase RimI-like enzyme
VTVIVRKAESPDVRPLAAALARAFEDDPLMRWLLPTSRQQRHLPTLFELALKYSHLPNHEVYTTAELTGGALWAPPGKWQTRPLSLLPAMPRFIVALGTRIPIAVRTIAKVEQLHPREPHWYLAVLGTEPAWQGKGVGSALLAPVLERCDKTETAAYLESSKETNIPFYNRHGFEVTGTIDLPRGGPRVWPMWREPRP